VAAPSACWACDGRSRASPVFYSALYPQNTCNGTPPRQQIFKTCRCDVLGKKSRSTIGHSNFKFVKFSFLLLCLDNYSNQKKPITHNMRENKADDLCHSAKTISEPEDDFLKEQSEKIHMLNET
jgi:hypothetical protein